MARKVAITNKREKIIEAANKLFCHYGYEKTTMDDIAKEAGIGKGTIYSEFSSKEDIMGEVILRFMQDVNRRTKEFVESSTGSILSILRDLMVHRILMYYDHSKTHFHGAEMFTVSTNNIDIKNSINLETDKIVAEMLRSAFLNGEIIISKDYLKTAGYIRKALISLQPPIAPSMYTREEIIDEANNLLDILLSGLTVQINFNIRKEAQNGNKE